MTRKGHRPLPRHPSAMLFKGILILLLLAQSAHSVDVGGDNPKLRDEDDVQKLREEALSKLEVPLEKMKIKELKQMLSDRGQSCTACSEKSQLVEKVKESIHLPVQKDRLKTIHVPKQTDDDEVSRILSELKKKQEEDKKLKDMLKKQGFNTDGMNFGGGMDPDAMEKILRNIKKDKPQE